MLLLLAQAEEVFGLPTAWAYVLGFVGVAYASYSLSRFRQSCGDHRGNLRTIARLNLAYCVASAALLVVHGERLTLWGKLYLCGEIMIVGLLAKYELRVAQGPSPGANAG